MDTFTYLSGLFAIGCFFYALGWVMFKICVLDNEIKQLRIFHKNNVDNIDVLARRLK